MTSKNTNEPHILFREVEERAASFPVQIVPLRDNSSGDQGLILYKNTASSALPVLLKNTAATLTENTGQTSCFAEKGKRPDSPSGLPDRNAFQKILETEIARVGSSRLPCTLILVSPCADSDSHSSSHVEKYALQQFSEIIRSRLGQASRIGHHDAGTLSILLPETNLGKGLYRAGEIQSAVCKNSAGNLDSTANSSVFMGIAVCHAFDNFSPKSLLDKAEQALKRAKKLGPGSICHEPPQPDHNFCQVTVEERAELFRFLSRE